MNWFQILCSLLICGASHAISEHPILIIVAFDGFRYDYIRRGLTPALEQLKNTGSSPEFMKNVFPTVTAPNFYAMSTGLYPETNGVMGNRGFNEKMECLITPEAEEEMYHYNQYVVPLWTLNEMNGRNRHSATMFWPASKLMYQNMEPTYKHDQSMWDFAIRVNTTIDWILDKEKPANLAFLYFGEPDSVGHEFGPESEQVDIQLLILNGVTQYLLYKLKQHDLQDRVNLIFLSDHGMGTTPEEYQIDYQQFLDEDVYTACGESPYWYISVKPGYEDAVHQNLTEASKKLGTFTVYRKDEVPDRWHIKNSKRMSDLLIVAKLPNSFTEKNPNKGNHGYDNEDPYMRPFFIANGPLFKSNFTVEPFENIDIYPLVMKILNLQTPPCFLPPNGTLSTIEKILRN